MRGLEAVFGFFIYLFILYLKMDPGILFYFCQTMTQFLIIWEGTAITEKCLRQC